MKKMFLSVLSVSAVLISFDANAMVQALKLNCTLKIVQANAPRYSLECGIISSFGPTTVNCRADESWIFPSVGKKSIRLKTEKDEDTSDTSALNFKGVGNSDDVSVTLNLGEKTATLVSGFLTYNCEE